MRFSYGTLRRPRVQFATVGHEIGGHRDARPVLRPTDRIDAHADGIVFAISEAEQAATDEYEIDDYRRIAVPPRSGATGRTYGVRRVTGSVRVTNAASRM